MYRYFWTACNISHRIHVLYIYLYVNVWFYGKNVGTYYCSSHGSYGYLWIADSQSRFWAWKGRDFFVAIFGSATLGSWGPSSTAGNHGKTISKKTSSWDPGHADAIDPTNQCVERFVEDLPNRGAHIKLDECLPWVLAPLECHNLEN